MRRFALIAGLFALLAGSGCISLKAPERIVINGNTVRASDDRHERHRVRDRDEDDDDDDDDDRDDD